MEYKLELVVVPVSDVDRAKAFYADQMGFTVDVDHQISDDMRVVQVTPPGSGCSISFGKTRPVVMLDRADRDAARRQVRVRGLDVGDAQLEALERAGLHRGDALADRH